MRTLLRCAMRDAVLADLEALGLYVSWGKCVLEQPQEFKLLGFIVDLQTCGCTYTCRELRLRRWRGWCERCWKGRVGDPFGSC